MSLLARYTAVVAMLGTCYQLDLDTVSTVMMVTTVWTMLGGYYTLYLMYHTLPRDLM